MITKEQELLELAIKRQATTYEGYSCIADYNNGAYECDYISPYSVSAHNVDADILIILQDWCSEAGFGEDVCEKTLKHGYTPSVRTNINLIKLLKVHLNVELDKTYATNLFPYIKKGKMSNQIYQKDLIRAANDFTLPAINIIKPKIAICLGLVTFNAIRVSCGHNEIYPMANAIDSSFSFNGTKIFVQAHTGQMGINNRNRGGVNRVYSDWNKMAEHLHEIVKNDRQTAAAF
jgi:hypothetical protein